MRAAVACMDLALSSCAAARLAGSWRKLTARQTPPPPSLSPQPSMRGGMRPHSPPHSTHSTHSKALVTGGGNQGRGLGGGKGRRLVAAQGWTARIT